MLLIVVSRFYGEKVQESGEKIVVFGHLNVVYCSSPEKIGRHVAWLCTTNQNAVIKFRTNFKFLSLDILSWLVINLKSSCYKLVTQKMECISFLWKNLLC